MIEVKLHDTTVILHFYKRQGDKDKIHIKNPTVRVDGVYHHFNFIHYGIDATAHTILIGDKFFLHNFESPALMLAEDEIDFFLYGHPVRIEDLHCDNEIKVCLKLKYCLIQNNDYYWTYTV